MGRLVRKPKLPAAEPQAAGGFDGMFQTATRAAPQTGAVAGDDYLTRMAK